MWGLNKGVSGENKCCGTSQVNTLRRRMKVSRQNKSCIESISQISNVEKTTLEDRVLFLLSSRVVYFFSCLSPLSDFIDLNEGGVALYCQNELLLFFLKWVSKIRIEIYDSALKCLSANCGAWIHLRHLCQSRRGKKKKAFASFSSLTANYVHFIFQPTIFQFVELRVFLKICL